ncbi:heme ABC exporter ATP-binding protein CcmA [Frigidibacter sp. RF13]|uniref:heme ABC exporter ATP-binding protein CcmA n=1 Tax=Frigidibacter sp. RF13 TaxID=2997340 RepID=UPI00227013E1|nr:heme ABC exporter ATP-binding protein CcmA [Frigidibacter sp. RF13]MCY1125890.1 heme ABC exporter ATP-binding protein CcmA [Frigidibacter sp. RF13]
MDLIVTELSVARGGIAILAGLGFAVTAGNALVLRGPNGVGKTTVLRTIAGLQPALTGRVAPGPEQIAWAGHADAVKSTLTVRENLAFWAAIYGVWAVDTALADLQLTDLADRPAQTLSAGQKRRLGLARLLLSDRPVWVLDEPTVSLDAATVAHFATLLSRHLRDGGAALLTSHVDLGLDGAAELDLSPYRARGAMSLQASPAGFDEAFL